VKRSNVHIDFTRARTLITNQARGLTARLALAARGEPATATGMAWAAIALVRLFLGGAVGLADNSNGHRLLCQLGVAAHPLAAGQQALSFVVPRYDAYTWFGEACSAGGSGQPFLSTEYFPLLYAKAATWVFGLPAALDLRMLGVLFALAVGAAVGWTVRELPGPTWVRVTISSLIGLVAVDSAIAPCYISPYTQPAVLIGLLLLVPALLRLFRRDRLHASDILIVAAVSLWTLWSDPQTWSLLLVIVPVLLLRPSLRPSSRAPGQWRFARTARLLAAVARRAPGRAKTGAARGAGGAPAR